MAKSHRLPGIAVPLPSRLPGLHVCVLTGCYAMLREGFQNGRLKSHPYPHAFRAHTSVCFARAYSESRLQREWLAMETRATQPVWARSETRATEALQGKPIGHGNAVPLPSCLPGSGPSAGCYARVHRKTRGTEALQGTHGCG